MKSDFALKTLDAKYAKKYQVTYMLWILNALKMSFERVLNVERVIFWCESDHKT